MMSVFLPCLLERWSSPAMPGDGSRSFNTWQDVRRDVLRNLEWLLNCEETSLLGGDSAVPVEVARSVLMYGIPAYSGKPQSAMKTDDVAWAIRERIVAFETRIEPGRLTVTAIGQNDEHTFNRMRFTIQGYLRADPVPIEFIVQSEIDLESGSARVLG